MEFKKTHNFGIGLNYTQSGLKHENILDSVIVYHYDYSPNPQIVDTTIVCFPISLIEKSSRVGLYFKYHYELFSKRSFNGQVGISTSIDLYEYAKAKFENKFNSINIESPNPSAYEAKYSYPGAPYNTSPYSFFSHFYLASVQFSTYYRQVFQIHEKFSLAAKVSFGTNLYSDWDQFKKYAWVGLGLEAGFGKVRSFGEKKEKE